jgi:hypothetical protein
MGGFHHFIEGSEGLEPCCMAPPSFVASQISVRELTSPTVEEINDKSKRKLLSTSLVLIQSCWFLLQCLARNTTGSTSLSTEPMRITRLELLTISYLLLILWIYWAWSDKPHGTLRPIRVRRESQPPLHNFLEGKTLPEKLCDTILGHRDHHIDMSKMERAPIIYSGNYDSERSMKTGLIALCLGSCFAGINCIAWSYPTQSFPELVLWRICSLSIFGLFGFAVTIIPSFHLLSLAQFRSESARETMRIIFLLCVVLYMISRIGSITLAFVELRSLPPSAYDTIYWTTLLPHI